MKTFTFLVVIIGVCAVAIAGRQPGEAPAKFTAKVVDEDGKPLAGMSIVGGFYSEEPSQRGFSDSNGMFMAECKAPLLGQGGFSVNHGMPGYYESHVGFWFKHIENGRWEPWNPVVTCIVRRVVNPIPMYAKSVETMIPTTNRLCGFDLRVGDWIAPYGIGKDPDVFFQTDRTIIDIDNFNVDFKVIFTNRLDGIHSVSPVVECSFTSPRFAPTDGYRTEYGRKMGRKSGRGSFNTDPLPEEYCVYRIRSIIDKKGQVESAYYGKITSGFRLAGYGAEKITLQFTYYLNPTPNDRNLEFDPKQNLFQHLKSSEQVTVP